MINRIEHEFDKITESSLKMLCVKLPKSAEKHIDEIMDALYGLITTYERGKTPKWTDDGVMFQRVTKLLE
jgi:hypothetical protein